MRNAHGRIGDSVSYDRLVQLETANIWRWPDGTLTKKIQPAPVGVLPGSFNPLHAGHKELRIAAERWLGGPVFYEMTITNADKPPLDAATLANRCRQFVESPLWLTRASTFAEKARLGGSLVFVVGADTAERIIDPRFYGHSETKLAAALHDIRRTGCRFLVAGRFWKSNFLTTENIPIPEEFADLFEALPESAFRCDLSSTQLREPQE